MHSEQVALLGPEESEKHHLMSLWVTCFYPVGLGGPEVNSCESPGNREEGPPETSWTEPKGFIPDPPSLQAQPILQVGTGSANQDVTCKYIPSLRKAVLCS